MWCSILLPTIQQSNTHEKLVPLDFYLTLELSICFDRQETDYNDEALQLCELVLWAGFLLHVESFFFYWVHLFHQNPSFTPVEFSAGYWTLD